MEPTAVSALAAAMDGRVVSGSPATVVTAGVTTDSRSIQPGQLFVALAGERFDGHDFAAAALTQGAAAVVVSRPLANAPAERGAVIQVADTLAALQRLAAWHRGRLRGTVIAITGANGKTTTKTLLAHVLAGQLRGKASVKSFNNHIGVPLTLLSADSGDDCLVVEIGTNHPGEVATLAALARPDHAIVTSLSESHLEGLGDVAGVAREETSQLRFLRPGGLALVNADHPLLVEHARQAGAVVTTFGTTGTADVVVGAVAVHGDGIHFTLRAGQGAPAAFSLPVLGRHNAVNAAAVRTVAAALGLDDALIRRQFASFVPPEGRHNLHRLAGLTVLDDCYNANPGSMAAALSTLSDLPAERRVFVSGDMLELGPHAERLHRELGQRVATAGVNVLVAVGPLGHHVTAGCPQVASRTFATSAEAAAAVAELVRPGDAVLIKGSRGIRLEVVRDAVLARGRGGR